MNIHAAVVADVNQHFGTRYTKEQCRNPIIAAAVCRFYLSHYAAKLPRPETVQDLARIWRHGPEGWRRADKEDYGRRVKNLYDEFANQ